MIEKLRHIEGVEVLRGDAPKSVECTTCAVSKMHQIINKNPTGRATKPFQVLHFDLTITDVGFDGTECITHFIDEFTSFNWVYFLVNHKKAILIPIFKSLINQCDRADLSLNSVVSVVRTGQETFIEKRLEDWLSGQGIEWDWSTKNTPEQNGTFEKFGHLLTEKARCIRHHAKLSENLYPECYLAAAYLLNRTPTSRLNWDSPSVAMQRATNQKITWDIARLKIFGCKAYPLLKKADASPKSHKLKSRAFIDYFIGYDSTNIFRVWNSEKGDVSDYRNVVFDENQFYNSYEKDDLLKKAEKTDFVEFRALDPKPSYTPIDSDDEDWLETPIRGRSRTLNPPDQTSSGEGVREKESSHSHTLKSTPASTSRGPSTPIQLHTPDETPAMTPEPPRSRYTGDGRSGFSLRASAPPESYGNVTQRHKKSKRPVVDLSTRPEVDLTELLETSQIPLEITDFRPRRGVLSADLDESNVIQGRRTRRPNTRYADSAYVAWNEGEVSKLPTIHMAYAFNASFMKGTINHTAPFHKPVHLSDLPDPPFNWRVMLNHSHAPGFKRAAEVEYSTLESRGT